MSALLYTLADPRAVRLVALALLLAIGYLALARPWRSALLFDAALLLAPLLRPWPILLALAVALLVFRWFAPLATMFGERADARFAGLTILLVRWCLPGWTPATGGGDAPRPARPAMGQTIALAAPVNAAPPMPRTRWVAELNDRPDDMPHVWIEGGSGTGKTTFARAVLDGRAGDVVIVGVKQDDAWAGASVYLSSARGPLLAALKAELTRRADADDRRGLTIVLDDYTRLAELEPDAGAIFREAADIGRTLRIRLIVLARGRLVQGAKLSGESDLREHFVFVSLSRSHGATLAYDGDTIPLDTAGLDRHVAALPPLDPARVWEPASRPPRPSAPPPAPSVLEQLLTTPPPQNQMNGMKEQLKIYIKAGIGRDKARELGAIFENALWTLAGEEVKHEINQTMAR